MKIDVSKKIFLFRDKTGRGIVTKISGDNLLSTDETDWDNRPLAEFIKDSEVGDEFNNRTMSITCIGAEDSTDNREQYVSQGNRDVVEDIARLLKKGLSVAYIQAAIYGKYKRTHSISHVSDLIDRTKMRLKI